MKLPFHTLSQLTILTPPNPTFKERLAVSELRRGLRQLGYSGLAVIGELPGPAPTDGELRFVLTAARSVTENYEVASTRNASVTTVTINGASQQALLYGVFEFLSTSKKKIRHESR